MLEQLPSPRASLLVRSRRAGALLLCLLCLLCAPILAGATGASADRPGRIVSLAPNLTEILFALGAGPQMAGVTDYCDYPPEARRLPRVGGYVNPSPEAVLALAPDLVVATPNVGNQPFVERLMRVGTRVVVVQARNLSEVFPAIETLGKAAGRREEASALNERLRDGIRAARARVAGARRPRTLLCVQLEPLLAAGHESYPNDLLEIAGGESIVPPGTGSYPNLSLELVVRAAPEIVIVTRMDSPAGARPAEGLLSWWGRWPSIPAVRDGRVHAVPGDTLLRPGPRLLDGIDLLIGLIHPDRRATEPPLPGGGAS